MRKETEMQDQSSVANRAESYFNGIIEHIPGINGVARQLDNQKVRDGENVYLGYFIAGYLSLAYPLTILAGVGLLKLLQNM